MKPGKSIRRYRENLRYSQFYVAEELGISQKTYSRIENDESSPSLDIFFKICKILNIVPGSLLTEMWTDFDKVGEVEKNREMDMYFLFQHLVESKNETIEALKNENKWLKEKMLF